jgi:uncharacterized membrane-anchored protein YitT (DUF2179 family)
MEEKNSVTPDEQNVLPPKITKENIDPDAGTKKGLILSWTRSIVYILIASFLISFTAYSLIAPNQFTIGGIAGIAILINAASDGVIPQSAVSFALNLPLVVCAFFFVKKRFAVLSIISTIAQTLLLLFFENLLPDFKLVFPGGETAKIFAAVASGLCIGVAIALAFKSGGSTGGGDILAVMIQKKIQSNVHCVDAVCNQQRRHWRLYLYL